MLANVPEADYRLYHGYAGWTDGQLAAELGSGCWFTAASPSVNDAFFRFEVRP